MASEEPAKKPLDAPAAETLTPLQAQLREDFANALARLRGQLGVEANAELCAEIDKRYRSTGD